MTGKPENCTLAITKKATFQLHSTTNSPKQKTSCLEPLLCNNRPSDVTSLLFYAWQLTLVMWALDTVCFCWPLTYIWYPMTSVPWLRLMTSIEGVLHVSRTLCLLTSRDTDRERGGSGTPEPDWREIHIINWVYQMHNTYIHAQFLRLISTIDL